MSFSMRGSAYIRCCCASAVALYRSQLVFAAFITKPDFIMSDRLSETPMTNCGGVPVLGSIGPSKADGVRRRSRCPAACSLTYLQYAISASLCAKALTGARKMTAKARTFMVFRSDPQWFAAHKQHLLLRRFLFRQVELDEGTTQLRL